MQKQTGCPFHQFQNIKEFDALDPAARENPLPYYDWLRDDDSRKVYKVPYESGFYMVHRYEDVKSVFADAENFSNEIIPTVKSPFQALMDGEEHARIRGVISSLFTQKNINDWEQQIRKIIITATDKLFQNKEVELFEAWANVIPLGTLSALFGLDSSPAAIKKLHDDSIAINKALFVTGGTGPRRSSNPNFKEKIKISWSLLKNTGRILRLKKLLGKQGMKELKAMISMQDSTLVMPRPNFDQIPSAITPILDLMITFAEKLHKSDDKNPSLKVFRNAINSEDISITEMMMAGAFILFAGYETTTSLLSNCFVHLARNPELFRQLKAHPEKIEDFIEESLRYYTPVGRFLRRAKNDVTLSGNSIPKGAIVILMPGAANTDPDKFENGCAFDMERTNNRQHLSFGKGAHFCVGATLARMQITIALTELLHRAETLHINEFQPMKIVTDRDNGVLRYETMIVRVR